MPCCMPVEEWRTVRLAPRYEVSSEGRVRNANGKVMKARYNRAGYLHIGLHLGGRGTQVDLRVNRIVLDAFAGAPPSPIHQAAHRNGIRDDNRAENLSWLTPVENQADMVGHGTRRSGESVDHRARLRESEVRRIWVDPRPVADISSEYGVSYSTVWQLKKGQTWQHLRDELGEPTKSRRGRSNSERLPDGTFAPNPGLRRLSQARLLSAHRPTIRETEGGT